eukprot:UN29962
MDICFILNMDSHMQPYYETRLRNELIMLNKKCSEFDNILPLINSSTKQTVRHELYERGGCLCITTRILVVDILNEVIPCSRISGFIIDSAHQVKENSNIYFILKIYKNMNKHKGFIKAITQHSDIFRKFSVVRLMKNLKNLSVKELYL